ncbi:MAG: hypothetical protein HYV39_03430 [Candidatus Levybacteria bacterium]|nr:hypothetical protein [Candidatus Levybacteria bacterium]
MASVKPSINLFKSRKKNFFERFMKWALTIGRIVVILTEGVALSAFLYRFTLDQQLIDLHDKIKGEQSLVKLLKNNEDAFRNLQERLTAAAQLSEAGKQTVNIFVDINSLASSDLTISTLALSENQIKIAASVQSVSALTNFIKNLRDHPKIQSVSLDKIENKTVTAVITVNITATIKKSPLIEKTP